MVEFGAGRSTKTPILLSAMQPAAYVPIDISGEYLQDSAAALDARFPAAPGPSGRWPISSARSTFPPRSRAAQARLLPRLDDRQFRSASATNLLRHFRDMLGVGSKLLIGMDRVKPVERLIAAYDDPEGVTAAFNLNLLERINRELGWRHPGRRLPP